MSKINSACKSAFYALNNIRKIRKYLDSHSTGRLIHAFIPWRIDNCKSLFCVLPVVEIAKLQRVQNAAARLVTGSKRTEHITPTLRNVYWLPVEQRIKFKTALLVYKALNGMSPSYIKKKPYCSIYSLDWDHAIKAFSRSQNQEHPVLVIECLVLQPQDYGTVFLTI